MADALSIIPASVLRNLADKLYEKRKNAALELEGIVKQLAQAGDHEKITAVIKLLTEDFTLSPQANHRKGGLIGLAAATVGLTTEAAQHLELEFTLIDPRPEDGIKDWESGDNTYQLLFHHIKKKRGPKQIVPPVLKSFSDQDSRVRYYACEALYNIAKVVRGDFIMFFNQIFDALCKLSADSDANVQSAAHLLDRLVKDIVTESDQFSIEEFIPLLRERMNVLNPYVRQFLVGWITVLDSVPDIDMLGFLPDFLDGLFNMLSDSSHEIRQQADSALSEFLQEIKNSPVSILLPMMSLFKSLFHYKYITLSGTEASCSWTNLSFVLCVQFLMILLALSKSVDYGRMAEILVQRAGSPDEFTRQTAITWINEFVKLGGDQLIPYYADILGAILPCISDKEEKIRVVARETNDELLAIRAAPSDGFDVGAILAVAKRHLSSEWEATRIEALHWISALLDKHHDEVLSFLGDIFDTLLKALSDPSDKVVLLVLEVHAQIAKDTKHFHDLVVFLVDNFRNDNSLLEKRGALIIRRLCVLLGAETVYRELSAILEKEADLDFASIMVQAYQHACTVIQSLVEEDINVKFLVQLDKLIRLLETPIFAYLRLQLLEPGRYPWLLKALYGLLMLLPQQSAAFKMLRTRLKTVPSYSFSGEQLQNTSFGTSHIRGPNHIPLQDGEMKHDKQGINFALRLQQFEKMQRQHRALAKSQAKSHSASASKILDFTSLAQFQSSRTSQKP
ncbi:hypothetical protein Cgig2_031764 [Carnegiea gigantea]|uniref:Vacuolar protein 14 C-terminal Fig4-binding domain-containing protein n=1 Tax=Carnegiea gigantea TaxID=171969 RepID=A0A9Q1KQ15_9CARY|nr:hypothetical protein Cgig2_031764 [Carnegiea gigantea]